MVFNENEQILLTHFHNLQDVTAGQLEAVRNGKMEVLDDILMQKQMIIERINDLKKQISIENCHPQIRGQIRKLVLKCVGLEEESRQYVETIQVAIRREMVSLRQENQLHEKYHAYFETSQLFDDSK